MNTLNESFRPLEAALHAAFQQAATGKGQERHGNGTAFLDQIIFSLADLYQDGHLFQAAKKMHESQKLEPAAAVRELEGAIVYLAAKMIRLNQQHGGRLFDQGETFTGRTLSDEPRYD